MTVYFVGGVLDGQQREIARGLPEYLCLYAPKRETCEAGRGYDSRFIDSVAVYTPANAAMANLPIYELRRVYDGRNAAEEETTGRP